jgi:hypothetical protein
MSALILGIMRRADPVDHALAVCRLVEAIMPFKFEERFKYRDERDVNPRRAAQLQESQKCLCRRYFSAFVNAGLPCRFGSR